MPDWERRLSHWSTAGLLDPATAARIREYELQRAAAARTRWSVWLALLFGAVLLAAGVLLLVSASWDQVSPMVRLALVVAMVAAFHVAGAVVSPWSERTALGLHLVGTLTLGPAIFLAGEILNLDEHWPAGVMLWAIGALVAWLLRRDVPHFGLVAVLVPAWLLCEWAAIGETGNLRTSVVGQAGAFLLALAYLTARRASASTPVIDRTANHRLVLRGLGAVALLPAGLVLGVQAAFHVAPPAWHATLPTLPAVGVALNAVAWSAALVIPLAVALRLRGSGAWMNALAAGWVIALALLPSGVSRLLVYGWLALGAIGLGAWGIREASTDRVNLATVAFALVVLFFYFDNLMDKMGRSASLIGLGLLFLVGGYLLERVRRRILAHTAEGAWS